MIRKSLRKIGIFPTCLAVTAGTVLWSVLLYLIISHLQDRVTSFGLIRAIIIPIIIATPVTYFFLRILRRLDLAEESLRASEERYRGVLEAAPDAITITRVVDGRYLEVNNAFCELSGYAREEAQGRTPADLNLFVNPTDRERLIRTLREKGKVADFDVQYRMRDGTIQDTILSAKPLRYKEEDCLITIATVITERKRAQEALRQSEERYRSLVENTLDGFFVSEIPSGRFIFLNKRSSELFGYTRQEGQAVTIWDVLPPEERGRVQKRIQERLEGKDLGNIRQIYTSVRKDGSTFRAEISTSMITYGEKPALQGVVRDVSEQERLQHQLERAQRLEAIGTLAGGIAHDFNNLLMAIQGNTSLLLFDRDITDPHRERIERIEQYVRDAGDLTRQLLGFARGGKYEVKPLDLNQTIHKTCEMFGRAKKEISIHTTYEENIWTVEADRGQIEQVLLNLYVNAWQAMPGSGDLYVQTENVTPNEEEARRLGIKPVGYVKISVTDTGVGMDEATLRRIFDPFFTTKEMGRGTGLGLASAYGIIKNHDGIIDVHSQVGQGTTFHLYLPASKKKVSDENDVTEEISRGSETILFVDDEEIIVNIGTEILKSLGYTVLSARGGREGIDIYKEKWQGIDLVILDMIMPDMGGGEVYDKLKEINPDVMVLLCSGYSMDGKAKEMLARGCDGFIQKPFNLNVLSRKLNEIFHKDNQDLPE